MKEIYVLLADDSGTMRFSDEPIGFAVNTKEEAEQYIKDGGWGYSHSYIKVRILDKYDQSSMRSIYQNLVAQFGSLWNAMRRNL